MAIHTETEMLTDGSTLTYLWEAKRRFGYLERTILGGERNGRPLDAPTVRDLLRDSGIPNVEHG